MTKCTKGYAFKSRDHNVKGSAAPLSAATQQKLRMIVKGGLYAQTAYK